VNAIAELSYRSELQDVYYTLDIVDMGLTDDKSDGMEIGPCETLFDGAQSHGVSPDAVMDLAH
jgi:hypothetical protein